jgi:hypothetical protein
VAESLAGKTRGGVTSNSNNSGLTRLSSSCDDDACCGDADSGFGDKDMEADEDEDEESWRGDGRPNRTI